MILLNETRAKWATGGVLAADECLLALRETGSFELRTGTGVQGLRDEGDRVVITLQDGEELSAEVVVNCAGHHALALLENVRSPAAAPPSLQQVVYLEPSTPDEALPSFNGILVEFAKRPPSKARSSPSRRRR